MEQHPQQPGADDRPPETAPGEQPANAEQEPQPEPPQIYVASLADYNNGKLYGWWIDATQEPDQMRQQIADMLAKSPQLRAEGETFGDWAIHDYEGFAGIRLGELEDIEYVQALAAGIRKHGDSFAAWAEVQGDVEPDDYDQLESRYQAAYLGAFDSLAAYGEHVWEEMGWQELVDAVLPPDVARYSIVNAEILARDLWFDGTIHLCDKPGGGYWIFLGDV